MSNIKANIENWHIQCLPDDGARISVLRFAGLDLLTAKQALFKSPERFYGEYETRPVYGYDDCFPTVDPCKYPAGNFNCRDHGELCWQKWQVILDGNRLICSTVCNKPNISFKRILEFSGNSLTWKFELVNLSGAIIPFLHVMHALMPLNEIQSMEFPEFDDIADENNNVAPVMKSSGELADHLLEIKPGVYEMLLLKNVTGNFIKLVFRNGIKMQIEYSPELFPTLGIWWNNAGYPDEEGLRRSECAFEPIPGSGSNLADSFKEGIYFKADPGKTLNWEMNWTVERFGI